jgi:uncharacterized protein
MLARYLENHIADDLREKMVFVGGPRQSGKTSLALRLLKDKRRERSSAYLNWDALEDRAALLAGDLPSNQPLIVLDEIHKFAGWRNLVKGYYDKHRSAVSVLVTGSARLDYYRKGGDSLQGRYHYYRLHPFSLLEVDPGGSEDALAQLLRVGGFPEPFLDGSERFHRRWLREMSTRITHEDVRDLEHVREHTYLDLLLHHLPACVGSPLSINSLRELLQVSHESVERWVRILENLYVVFRVAPFGSGRIRAVKKEQKLYFRDWSRVADEGARFENLVACQLLKYCEFVEDTDGFTMELRYLRDTDGREVDFVVLRDGHPEFAVECKRGERRPAPACDYFRGRTEIPEFFQVHLSDRESGNEKTGTRVLPFAHFCVQKNLP